MTWAAWTIVGIVLFVEAVIAYIEVVWWDDLKFDRQYLEQAQAKCFVCLTGASVTSFKNNYNMCHKHLAHWVLIHDLEEKTRKELG